MNEYELIDARVIAIQWSGRLSTLNAMRFVVGSAAHIDRIDAEDVLIAPTGLQANLRLLPRQWLIVHPDGRLSKELDFEFAAKYRRRVPRGQAKGIN